MTYQQTISIDAMGGDHGPSVMIAGAAKALEDIPDSQILFFGKDTEIQAEVDKHPILSGRCQIIHTDKTISSTDKPSAAIRAGKGSSMRMAIESVKNGQAESVVSAGNTGALMAMSKLILKCLPGITRPALASVFPSTTGETVVLDLGANLACDAEILSQFAVLGAVYARVVKGMPHPRVGLLNVGTEEMKGHEEVRAASAILTEVDFPGEYIGFIEGNDLTNGRVDVAVSDGFTGNVALKTAEGVGKLTSHLLREAFKSSPLAFLGYLFAMRAMNRMKDKVDPSRHNGGMFLGLNGVAVKSHGGSNTLGTSHAILMAADLVRNGFNKRVAYEIEQLISQESFFTSVAANA